MRLLKPTRVKLIFENLTWEQIAITYSIDIKYIALGWHETRVQNNQTLQQDIGSKHVAPGNYDAREVTLVFPSWSKAARASSCLT